jgi:predicted MPP superfamily phosphohydrolase
MLMNERDCIKRGHDGIWLAGVDDPHHYRMDDIAKSVAGIPAGETAILLSHSADNHVEAAAAGVDLFLCGHTHGGQICLPGGFPLVTSTRLSRRFAAGAWQYGGMAGYTSRGIGTSAIDARFNCAPEATLHTLRRA